jgi:HSP20 family protein
VIADLPGVNKEDINIDVDGNVLSVSAERKQEEEKNEKFHRVERSYGKIHRVVRLPDTADLGSVAAAYNDGVLRIVVPKAHTDRMSRSAREYSAGMNE